MLIIKVRNIKKSGYDEESIMKICEQDKAFELYQEVIKFFQLQYLCQKFTLFKKIHNWGFNSKCILRDLAKKKK